ncbi:hypothetical protein LZZ85_11490 [Terrimonas sp. NA20]|uniref:Uncharacterized protein n=1 Tax=Terrimonas ginsenosidimutans TaxID=2908004 RepID=A0ABS9KRJ1_9BACT|nr:hypothetical protein [Terrimonas ginsenosidimutans]MCG2614912.1 hypothetical protein [Terrimonas ginsenosidimutans]
MKKVLLLFTMSFACAASFAQIGDTAQLNKYLRDTIRDRRPEKVSAADLQKAFFGISNILGKKGELKSVNLPMTFNDGVVELPQASRLNDGYVSAPDYDRFDSAAKNWKDTTGGFMTNRKPLLVKNLYTADQFYITMHNGGSPVVTGMVAQYLQSVAFGGRGAAARYAAGTATGLENVFLGEYSGNAITTARLNAYGGKASAYLLTTGERNAEWGAHRLSVTTGSDWSSLGFGVSGFTPFTGSRIINIGSGVMPDATDASDQLNVGYNNDYRWMKGKNKRLGVMMPYSQDPQEALHVAGKIKADTIPSLTSADSLLVPINGVIHRIHKNALGISGGGGATTGGTEVFTAVSGQTTFTTVGTLPSNDYKVTVFRNGVDIDFSRSINSITITASEAGDKIKIKWYN